jgi:hypothetical protein
VGSRWLAERVRETCSTTVHVIEDGQPAVAVTTLAAHEFDAV